MRILLVEDEPDVRLAISRSLREEGYAVDEADNGIDGLAKAKWWEYDAIILDVMLPKMDGLKVLTALREKLKTPVLILSARDSLDNRIQGLDSGADDYLVKPFSMAELFARLRALIRRSAGNPDPIIRHEDITLDLRTKRVTKGDTPVDLTAREYSLFELLMLNRGSLVTRTKIYEHLVDEDDSTIANVVEVHMLRIRKKLGRDIIATRRGLGYIIDG
jgi:two-component system OmpR family response regulator